MVTPEDSMKSRNGGLTRPSSGATTHQAMASDEASSHHAENRTHRRSGRWQAHQMIAGQTRGRAGDPR